ncbi:MAG: Type 1 glutamine amidotransferase-like domain-containing protein [Victivallaceae bacterium]|nr:Type 1 glutamine amidotransferase-like domain-containing protein [Victivallaceae bacterium]
MNKMILTMMSAACLAGVSACTSPDGVASGDQVCRKAVLGWGGDAEMGNRIVEFCGRPNPEVVLICAPGGDSPAAFDDARKMFAASSSRIREVAVFGAGMSCAHLRDELKSADIIWVCGGMTENLNNSGWTGELLLALREAYDRGVVVSGYSAGAICWTFAGYNDFADGRYDLIPGCGFLPVYFCPHYQDWGAFDERLYRESAAPDRPDTAFALTDGAALFFTDGVPGAVFRSPEAQAIRFVRSDGRWTKSDFTAETP